MIINNIQPELVLSEADTMFVQEIQNRITEYGQIAYSVPPQVIINAIQFSMKAFLRLGYAGALIPRFVYIPRELISKHDKMTGQKFGQIGYTVSLPLSVVTIWEIYECNVDRHVTITASNNMDESGQVIFREGGASGGGMYGYGMYGAGINRQLYSYEKAATMLLSNAQVAAFGRGLPYFFNNKVGSLTINDNVRTNSFVMKCEMAVPVDAMYTDDLFIRHVLATCKKSLRRILGAHTATLVGETTLNVDDLCDNIEDAGTVEDMLKMAGGLGHIIMSI